MADVPNESPAARLEKPMPDAYLPQGYPLWCAYLVSAERLDDEPRVVRVVGWEVHQTGYVMPISCDLGIAVDTSVYYFYGYGERPEVAVDQLARVITEYRQDLARDRLIQDQRTAGGDDSEQ
jgi:hypothetical protein